MTKFSQFSFFSYLLIFLFAGCSKKISDLSAIDYGELQEITEAGKRLSIKFMGVACFLIEYNGSAVLTDPFISNPPMGKVFFGKIKTNPSIVDQFIQPADLKKVKTVVVGHAHYDHLLDLPYLSKDISEQAVYCGSKTMAHTIAPWNLEQRQITLNEKSGDSMKTGKWIYASDSTIRIMSFLSDHPPHFMNITMYMGPLEEDLKSKPLKTRKWKCGQPLSYLIDFLETDKQSIAHRVFFQSSGSEPPLGFYPKDLNDEKKPDVAIYSIAIDFDQEYYPYEILEYTDPEVIFLAHWENFFRKKDKCCKAVQGGRPEEFKEKLEKKYANKKFLMPAPGAQFIL